MADQIASFDCENITFFNVVRADLGSQLHTSFPITNPSIASLHLLFLSCYIASTVEFLFYIC